MSASWRLALAALLVLGTSGGCARPAVVRLTEADDARTVVVDSGSVLALTLGTTRSTGYDWRVVALDTRHLALVGESVERADSGPPGAPSRHVFRFVAREAGQTRLELEYARPWEKGVPPRRTWRLTVEVR